MCLLHIALFRDTLQADSFFGGKKKGGGGNVNRIKELRLERRLSGPKLADMLGISTQYLYDLERGERRLNDELIRKLVEIFGVSADEILGLDKSTTQDDQPDNEVLTEEEKQFLAAASYLFRNGKKLTKEEQRILLQLRKKK